MSNIFRSLEHCKLLSKLTDLQYSSILMDMESCQIQRLRKQEQKLNATQNPDLHGSWHCIAIRYDALHYSAMPAMPCNALQCPTMPCNALQCPCNALQCPYNAPAMPCNAPAMRCNALQCLDMFLVAAIMMGSHFLENFVLPNCKTHH